ncbi:PAS/PAC sensor signal transduction histidine kinase [Halospina denitrificans]|uniref:Phosphate regulon sensor protein PhoR n=1 Tax=Halospina denitrificans TaxID=332522 RepID=A0A4R7JRH4_9GAMM|nr:phosphate regulon sensor histidine kinase PhoR [Halospina denitrificans]TDT40336.1 PAS/PAC sensor signal transduction histidine kinase [Halospina denitrificans]
MRHALTRHLRRLLLLLAAATGIGWLVGYTLVALLIAIAFYLGSTLVQLARLHHWLTSSGAGVDPPESTGLWGEVFDDIYRLQKRHFSARDRLQTMVNRIRESTNSLRDGVVMTDAEGAMEWWNHAAEYLCGFRTGKDRGEYIYNLIRDPEFRGYFDAKDYSEPLEIASPARPQLRLQIQINLFGEDDRLITIKDVTRIHQLEKMRRDFVSNVSHEMRTPLTVISGYLETLSEQTESIPPGWQRPLATMQHQANRMEALITDLLLLSRLETSERRTGDAVCYPEPLLRQIQQDAIALSGDQQHRITLSIDDSHAIQGDENQLRSAFSNLVFNAVKYTPAGGTVQIRYGVDDDAIRFSVTDNGSGIDPEHIPRLTERFYRADPSRSKETGGTGLGLAIVKHILYNHDGHLSIDSTPGQGSTFTCSVPIERIIREGA